MSDIRDGRSREMIDDVPIGRDRSRSPIPVRRRASRSRSGSPRPRKHTSARRAEGRGPRSFSKSPERVHRPRGHEGGSRMNGARNSSAEPPSANKCIGVFGLSLRTTERDLKDVFSRYGKISQISVVMDAQTGRSRGFAFIYFDSVPSAESAKESCNGIEIDGKTIRVDFSITQRPHTPTPGVYMGKSSERRRYNGGGYNNNRRNDYRGGGGGGFRDNFRDRRDNYNRRDNRDYGRSEGRRDYRERSPSPYARRKRSHSPRSPRTSSRAPERYY